MAYAGRPEQAKAMYHKALALLDAKDGWAETPQGMRSAAILSNLGHLAVLGAKDAFRRSIAISTYLVNRKPPSITDTHTLAIAQNNLGQLLMREKRLTEAGTSLAQSVGNLEEPVADAPRTIDFQSHFGYVLAQQASFFEQTGKLVDATSALARAVTHQRLALKLSRNRSDVRTLLGSEILELAQIYLKTGGYKDAAALALELPKIVPSSARDQACFDAARVLARLVTQVNADTKLAEAPPRS